MAPMKGKYVRAEDYPIEDGKRSKSSVDYKLGGPHCHACRFFIDADESGDMAMMHGEQGEVGHCKLVAGPIGEHMVCKLFQRE